MDGARDTVAERSAAVMPYAPLRRTLMPLGHAWGGGYANRVKNTATANLIAYWPLWEASGTTASDYSGNSRTGTYSNVTLGATGIGDGNTAASFSSSYVNVYGAGLVGAFSGAEGTVMAWLNVANVGVWSDGITREFVTLMADSSNRVLCYRNGGANGSLAAFLNAGGTLKSGGVTGLSTTSWFHMALTYSKSGDALKFYYNGTQQGATATGLGIWAGSLASNTTVVGALSTAASNPWSGSIAHVAVWNTPLLAAQIAALATV